VHLTLADWLMENPGATSLAEVESLLLQVRENEHAPLAGRAVEMLARTALAKGLTHDAAHCYKLLARDYGKVVIRDGKTGAEIVHAAESDDRLAALLAEDAAAWPAKMRGTSENGDFHLEKPTLALPLPKQAAP